MAPHTISVPQSQMNVLELGLRNMRRSSLRTMPEFIDMYESTLKHFTDVKIAHLVATPQDTMEHYVQDTRFFYLLVQMVSEVLSHTDRKQVRYLRQVYRWFRHNKHVLHCGPHFGKQKKKLQKMKRALGMPPKAILKLAGKKDQEEKQVADVAVTESPHAGGTDAPPPSLYSPHSITSTGALMVKTMQQVKEPRPSSPIRRLQPTIADVSSPYIFMGIRGREKLPPGGVVPPMLDPEVDKATRTEALKKWEEYRSSNNMGQEQLSKLQYVGRSGLPGIPRYTAHDRCLNAEEFTQSIIDNYSHLDEMTKMQHGNAKLDQLKQDLMLNVPLNDFYNRAKNYFPIDYPKYPAFHARIKSAPQQDAEGGLTVPALEKRSKSARVHRHKKEKPTRPIKLNTIVNLIDSVTEEMNVYKEKMTPDPQPGFRQPAITFNPNERPLTAPQPGETGLDGLAPPSQQWKPAFLTEAVDWRGRITAEPFNCLSSINVLYDAFPQKQLENIRCSACTNVPMSPMKGQLTKALVRMSVVDPKTQNKRYVYVRPVQAKKREHGRPFFDKPEIIHAQKVSKRSGYSRHSYVQKMDFTDRSVMKTGDHEGRPQTCPVTDWETVKAQERFDRMNRQGEMGDHLGVDDDDIPALLQVQRMGRNTTPRSKRSRYYRRHHAITARELISSDDDSQVPSLEFVPFSSSKRILGKRSSTRTTLTSEWDLTTDLGANRSVSASSSAVVGDDKASDGDVESQGSNDDSLSSDAQDVDDLQNDLDLLSDEEGVEEWGEAVSTAKTNNRKLIREIYDLIDEQQTLPEAHMSTGEDHAEEQKQDRDDGKEEYREEEYPSGSLEGAEGLGAGEKSAEVDMAMAASIQAIEDYKMRKSAARCRLAITNRARSSCNNRDSARVSTPDFRALSLHSAPVPPGVITARMSQQDGEPFEDLYLGYKDGFTSSTLQQTAVGSTGPRTQSRGATPRSRLVESPEHPTSRVRSAGRAPSRPTKSKTDEAAARHALQLMTTRIRVPPSIPSMHGAYGVRSPRKGVYDPCLDAHARKETMPKNYLNKVRQLRSEPDIPTEPPETGDQAVVLCAPEDLLQSLRVIHLGVKDQAGQRQTMPSPMFPGSHVIVTPTCCAEDQTKDSGYGENRSGPSWLGTGRSFDPSPGADQNSIHL
ncbi:hypothetical protein LSAT2_003223 [Lamellibrachia satsuma]|nr:hypothetical protein LSAT2_003223 [Lamellibrachia satsuma]